MRNILLTIAYDGTGFAGWQRQKSARTVSGELEKVFSKICGEGIRLEGAGRTDAGVHALGMCAGLRGEFGIPAGRMAAAANDLLMGSRINRAGEIRVIAAEEMPEHFHARFDAKSRTYLYRIISSPEIDIFKRNYAYQVQSPLDISAMREAAVFLVGTLDYTSFMSRGGSGEDGAVRTVSALEIEFRESAPTYGGIDMRITADGFLYNMVRIIAGTLVEVGDGRRTPESVRDSLLAKDRAASGHRAPAGGLYLEKVHY